MKFGKILGSISPAFGLLAGQGLFGSHGFKQGLGMMSPMAGMLGLGRGHGDEQQQPQVQPQAMPGEMQMGNSPMAPMQQGQGAPPSFPGQGMFGAGAPDPRQQMMQRYRQWQMINGGGY